MIRGLWDWIVEKMTSLGWQLDAKEDDLRSGYFTIDLPGDLRKPEASTMARARVERDIRIRLQFRSTNDPAEKMNIHEEIERVVTALRSILLFEASTLTERTGGTIAEIRFSAIDTMS